MGINKVTYGNDVLVDLTSDTVTPNTLLSGATAHDNSGTRIAGTFSESDPIFTASAAYGITSSDITNWNNKQAKISSITVTISAADWSATTTCTKSVSGVTTSNNVVVAPAPASISDWKSAGVYCSAQGSGTLTFTCSSTPSASITVNVLILN